MGLMIKNGEIVTPIDRYVADIYIRDGVIQAIGSNLDAGSQDQVIDASGQYVFPGAIDPHTHLDMPFMGTVNKDDYTTGTIAAIAGGTTGVIDFVLPNRGQSLLEALDIWHGKGRDKAACDYTFHMAVTGWHPNTAKEMAEVVQKHGVTSFKVFMAYKGSLGVDDGELLKVMQEAEKLGAMVNVHAENPEIIDRLTAQLLAEGKTEPKYHAASRPNYVEGEGTHRALTVARMTGCPVYIVHMTARESVQELVMARSLFQPHAYGETCPQYLVFDESVYDKPNFEGAKYVMSPPIRSKADQEVLWQALAEGFIQVVGTDHCPFDFKGQKDMGRDDFSKIPNGAPGIENRLHILYTYGVLENRISLNRFVEVVSTNPAKIFGMYPKKGAIAIGSDADIVIWDKTVQGTISAKTHRQRVDHNIYEGMRYTGAPSHVLVRGELVYKEGAFLGEPGFGQFLKRPAMKAVQPELALA